MTLKFREDMINNFFKLHFSFHEGTTTEHRKDIIIHYIRGAVLHAGFVHYFVLSSCMYLPFRSDVSSSRNFSCLQGIPSIHQMLPSFLCNLSCYFHNT